MVARGVELSIYTDGGRQNGSTALSKKAEHPIRAHLYLDTGLGRMGMPYHRALPWIEELAARDDLVVGGDLHGLHRGDRLRPRAASALPPPGGAGRGQRDRSGAPARGVLQRGVSTCRRRAWMRCAQESPSTEGTRAARRRRGARRSSARPPPAGPVVRVEHLRPGDSAGYGRRYVAQRPTWLATLPAGHVDGVPRKAVDGARVLIADRTFLWSERSLPATASSSSAIPASRRSAIWPYRGSRPPGHPPELDRYGDGSVGLRRVHARWPDAAALRGVAVWVGNQPSAFSYPLNRMRLVVRVPEVALRVEMFLSALTTWCSEDSGVGIGKGARLLCRANVLHSRNEWDDEDQRERPSAGIVEEQLVSDPITGARQSRG